MQVTLGQQHNVGEKEAHRYTVCTLTLIAMQGHQKNSKNKNKNNYCHLVARVV